MLILIPITIISYFPVQLIGQYLALRKPIKGSNMIGDFHYNNIITVTFVIDTFVVFLLTLVGGW
jgi:hypothetical protein